MRVKILDAWCWGLPVVSTTIGAEGVTVREGDDILIADAPAGLAVAVLRLLSEPGLRERLRTGGRRRVETHYDWQHVYPAWDQVYAKLIEG
jgi:glycosyltransferase involved in cell wall biosynthesis